MSPTLAELAAWVGGTLEGDGRLVVHGAAPQGIAKANEITLVDSAERAKQTGAGHALAAVVPPNVDLGSVPTIRVDDAHAAFARIVAHFRPPRPQLSRGISPRAYIDSSAQVAEGTVVMDGASLGPDVQVGPRTVIHRGVQIMAGTCIGADCEIYPNAVLYENTLLGDRVTIHAGAVIGCYGFGYRQVDGHHERSAQLGNVEIQDDVEIGANTTIDRGAYGPTRIGQGTKIDNLVMIAHNCQIGRHNLICSLTGIAGSSSTGDYVTLAGQVGVRDHTHIGTGAVIGAQAGVVGDVPEKAHLLGSPAIADRDFWVQQSMLAKLPEMRRQLKSLQRAIDALQSSPQFPQADGGE